jgi:hypothetical protein
MNGSLDKTGKRGKRGDMEKGVEGEGRRRDRCFHKNLISNYPVQLAGIESDCTK